MTYYQSDKNQSGASRKSGKVYLGLASAFIFLALSIFYLVQVNTLIAKNFELRNFQKVLAQSQKENQYLSVSLTQIQSISNLQQAAKDLNLVSIENVKYLKIVPGFFALSD
jgi:hypothetical protein